MNREGVVLSKGKISAAMENDELSGHHPPPQFIGEQGGVTGCHFKLSPSWKPPAPTPSHFCSRFWIACSGGGYQRYGG